MTDDEQAEGGGEEQDHGQHFEAALHHVLKHHRTQDVAGVAETRNHNAKCDQREGAQTVNRRDDAHQAPTEIPRQGMVRSRQMP